MPVEASVAAANQRAMALPATVAHYAAVDYLDAGEALVYAAAAREAAGEPILDLGVGGGRTVPALTALSRDYLAVDCEPAMVEATRRRFPHLDVRPGDARDLRALPAGLFGLVVFSCAGLDMVGHADRQRVLAEVHRVLRPGGLFAFSTHNWERRRARPGDFLRDAGGSAKRRAGLLRRLAGALRHAPRRLRNRRALRAVEERHEGWAVVVSPYHDFATLMLHVTVAEQRAELARAGFLPGARVATHEGAWLEGDRTDTFLLHVLARKPG